MGILKAMEEQCKRPDGKLGRFMLKSCNVFHKGFFIWATEIVRKPSSIVLDIGCGTGETIYKIADKYKDSKVYGLDYSDDSIKMSEKRNESFINEGRVKIVKGNVEEMPFKKETFDYIFAIRTHYFWTSLDETFREIFRTLKNGGSYVIMSESQVVEHNMVDYHSDDELKELLLNIGFTKVERYVEGKRVCIIAQK